MFNPMVDCVVCVRQKLKFQGKKGVTVPHKSHHVRCPKNRTTRGASAQTVMVNRIAEANIKVNNEPINTTLGMQLAAKNGSRIPQFFGGPQQRRLLKKSPVDSVPNQAGVSNFILPATNETIVASDSGNFREVVDRRILALEGEDPDFDWFKKKKGVRYPSALVLSIDYIVNEFKHQKPTKTSEPLPSSIQFQSAEEKYRKYFAPGSCKFTFPKDLSGCPSPHYHSIEGESFIYLDWKLIDPSVPLPCFHCVQRGIPKDDCCLVHKRTNFSKSRNLFPLWTGQGRPTLCVLMNYECQHCNITYAANDGRLLSLLPAHVRSIYPVDPIYASGSFHLHKDLTFDLEILMKTYANGKFVSGKLYRKIGKEYTEKLQTYLSQGADQDFISFQDWNSGISVPSFVAHYL